MIYIFGTLYYNLSFIIMLGFAMIKDVPYNIIVYLIYMQLANLGLIGMAVKYIKHTL